MRGSTGQKVDGHTAPLRESLCQKNGSASLGCVLCDTADLRSELKLLISLVDGYSWFPHWVHGPL